LKQLYNTKIYNTALYLRLSRDDELQGESGSIQTQRMMLRQYAAENGLSVVDEYIDDGWSGTNFDRPGFQRMIDDIEEGKINCVVTKDLSRLGRNYILTGQYTEIYFPSKGVRYIAINDNVDTNNGESELAPFLNILNEMHARQTSKKVKAAMHTRFANGAHYGTYAPIGYVKDPEKKGHLLVDSETRWIVEKIFDLASHGAGAAKITNILLREQVPTPGWLNYQRYGTFAHIYEGAPEEKRFAWTIAQVKSILKEETYIGNSIHNKQSNISFKNKKKVRKPKEEWYRVENTHEAIISEDVFRQVQEQILSRRRKQKNGKTQIFSGLVRCADCGWTLAYGENKANKKPYGYFCCSQYRQGLQQCKAHYIRFDVLYPYVLSRVQYWSGLAQKDDEKLLKQLLKASDNQRNSSKKKNATDLRKAEKRKAEVDGLFAKMYEDWSAGRITEYNFNMLSEKYQREQQELEEKIQKIREAVETAVQTESDAGKWVDLIKQYTNPTELTAELLNTLIEKIVVHEAIKHEDGSREQEVEIFYRFIGKID
jgi:DNA invertase Pin-like site-specific DNA recombinase